MPQGYCGVFFSHQFQDALVQLIRIENVFVVAQIQAAYAQVQPGDAAGAERMRYEGIQSDGIRFSPFDKACFFWTRFEPAGVAEGVPGKARRDLPQALEEVPGRPVADLQVGIVRGFFQIDCRARDADEQPGAQQGE